MLEVTANGNLQWTRSYGKSVIRNVQVMNVSLRGKVIEGRVSHLRPAQQCGLLTRHSLPGGVLLWQWVIGKELPLSFLLSARKCDYIWESSSLSTGSSARAKWCSRQCGTTMVALYSNHCSPSCHLNLVFHEAVALWTVTSTRLLDCWERMGTFWVATAAPCVFNLKYLSSVLSILQFHIHY